MNKVIFCLLILTAACTDIEVTRGAELKQEKIDRITTESNKGDVINLLGSPSSKSSFGQETWYYISSRKEQNIIGSDNVIEQQILEVTFNADDKVHDVKLFNKDDMQEVDFSDRKTSTAGHEMTILEQVLGNVGKFNKEGDGPVKSRGGGSIPGR